MKKDKLFYIDKQSNEDCQRILVVTIFLVKAALFMLEYSEFALHFHTNQLALSL